MRALKAERACGLRHVPAIFLQLAQNEFTFIGAARFVQGAVWLMQAFRDAAEQFRRQMMRLDARLRADNYEPLDEILQFADVSGPGIAHQNIECSFAELTCFLSVL